MKQAGREKHFEIYIAIVIHGNAIFMQKYRAATGTTFNRRKKANELQKRLKPYGYV